MKTLFIFRHLARHVGQTMRLCSSDNIKALIIVRLINHMPYCFITQVSLIILHTMISDMMRFKSHEDVTGLQQTQTRPSLIGIPQLENYGRNPVCSATFQAEVSVKVSNQAHVGLGSQKLGLLGRLPPQKLCYNI